MAREPINRKWNEVPDAPNQYEEPNNATWEEGWRGGANEEPPEAKYQNWWQRRVDDALQDLERLGAMSWVSDAVYSVGAYARGADDIIYRSRVNANENVNPVGDASGSWETIAQYITRIAFESGQFVPVTRNLAAGDGLAGGGDLSANRTLSVDSSVTRNSDFSRSGTSSGTFSMPGGFYIKWGNLGSGQGVRSISFASAFPNACVAVVPSVNGTSTDPERYKVYISGITRFGFSRDIDFIGFSSGTYIAIGY